MTKPDRLLITQPAINESKDDGKSHENGFIRIYSNNYAVRYPINAVFLFLVGLSEFGFLKFSQPTIAQAISIGVYGPAKLIDPECSILDLYHNKTINTIAWITASAEALTFVVETFEVKEAIVSIVKALDASIHKSLYGKDLVAYSEVTSGEAGKSLSKLDASLMLISFIVVYGTFGIASTGTFQGLKNENLPLASLGLIGQILLYALMLRAAPARAIMTLKEMICNDQVNKTLWDKIKFWAFHGLASINRGLRIYYISQRLFAHYPGAIITGFGGAYMNLSSTSIKQYEKQKKNKETSWVISTIKGYKDVLEQCTTGACSNRLFSSLSALTISLFCLNRFFSNISMTFSLLDPSQIYIDEDFNNLLENPTMWMIWVSSIIALILIPTNVLLSQFLYEPTHAGFRESLRDTPGKIGGFISDKTALCFSKNDNSEKSLEFASEYISIPESP